MLFVLVSVVLAAASDRGPAVPAASGTFRVATFNIHKGADIGGHYDLERTIDAIRHLDAHLVGVQEVMRNHMDTGCEDQPARITEGLRRRTGRAWTYAYVPSWITERRECQDDGRGDGVETEGVAFFAAERIAESGWVRLSEGRVGLAVRLVSMPHVPVIVTHLAANRENQPDRVRELGVLLPWAERLGPGLLVGDLNAQPDAEELVPVFDRYRDAWIDGLEDGRAAGVLSGSTRPGRRVSRIDYVLYAPLTGLALESVEILDTTTVPELGDVSDHHPVVATFRRSG
jgi:endonuclease/exonuclease/phosphatase family metal-dependent hydrolase